MNAGVTIKKRLIDLRLSITEVAATLGCSRSHASSVIWGRKATPYVRRGLAEVVGIPYQKLWGEPDPGTRSLPGGRPRGSDSVTAVNGFDDARGAA